MAYVGYHEQSRPELFDLLTIDESYDRVDWEAVIARVRSNPHEASWFVPGSASTVRLGGYYGNMMGRCGGGDGSDDDEEDDDDDDSPLVGWTALHTAMYVEPPPEAVAALLEAFPRAARMESARGDVPLHFVRFTEIGPGVVRVLLDAAPSALSATNNAGDTPLDSLCKWWAEHVGEERGTRTGAYDDETDVEDLDVPIGRGREYELQWQKIEVMLREAAEAMPRGSDGDNESDSGSDNSSREGRSRGRMRKSSERRFFRPLHAACGLCCPPAVIRYAHSRDRSQILERDRMTGRPPLSAAAASPTMCGKSEGEARALLEEILSLDTSAASKADLDGRLPLHLAIESCLTWDGGIESVLRAAPRALRTRDVTTHLFPFMAAAVGAGGGCSDLDTVYMLLRNGPEMAAGMTDDPPWRRVEKRWQRRIEEERGARRAEVDGLRRELELARAERDEAGRELEASRRSNDALKEENCALKVELERMRMNAGIMSAIGEALEGEDDMLESSESCCHKRQRV